MLTIRDPGFAESILLEGKEEFRIIVFPNYINKFQLYLTGRVTKGVQVFGKGPMSMRGYYSLLDYAKLVGYALDNRYDVFLRKDKPYFSNSDWYIEFRLK